MKLKRLTVYVGDGAIQLQNWKQSGEEQVPTPIDYDPETKIAVHHLGERDKQYIDLNKVMMYRIEEEETVLQS